MEFLNQKLLVTKLWEIWWTFFIHQCFYILLHISTFFDMIQYNVSNYFWRNIHYFYPLRVKWIMSFSRDPNNQFWIYKFWFFHKIWGLLWSSQSFFCTRNFLIEHRKIQNRTTYTDETVNFTKKTPICSFCKQIQNFWEK